MALRLRNLMEDYSNWQEIKRKILCDADGFSTYYTWYKNDEYHVFIFGDNEVYNPENCEWDYSFDIDPRNPQDAYQKAEDWFNTYNGFEDYEPADYIEEELAKPEGDEVKAFNNALKYAKKDNSPYCYGYTNSRVGKFFAFEHPFKWNGDDKAFRAKYKNASSIHVVYPNNTFKHIGNNEVVFSQPASTVDLNEYKQYCNRYADFYEKTYDNMKQLLCSNIDKLVCRKGIAGKLFNCMFSVKVQGELWRKRISVDPASVNTAYVDEVLSDRGLEEQDTTISENYWMSKFNELLGGI